MKCPVDGEVLQMSERQGVEVDYCARCRGVWLDRGELDKILERAAVELAPPPDRDRWDDDWRDRDRPPWRDDDRPPWRDDDRGERGHHRKKKRSFLSDMFEFGD